MNEPAETPQDGVRLEDQVELELRDRVAVLEHELTQQHQAIAYLALAVAAMAIVGLILSYQLHKGRS